MAPPGESPMAPLPEMPLPPEVPATKPSAAVTGRVSVEGDAVEQVFLGRVEAGDVVDVRKAITLRRPNLHAAIPAGPYALVRIDLKGGFIHIAPLRIDAGKVRLPTGAERLTVRPDKPCELKVGLPLRPVLLVGRRGRMIQLVYAVYDAQSRYYAEKRQDKPPQFSASCDGRELASGALQYSRAGTYGGAWRVPSTQFSGPLSIVASAELGEMGRRQTRPVLIDWHWYDQLFPFAGWALLGVLLLLVPENRNRQALLILIPFVLLSEIMWPWVAYFLAVLAVDTTQVSYPFQWLLVAWTALWLLSPWLLRLRPVPAIGLALVVAAGIGVAAEFVLCQGPAFTSSLMNYAILILASLLAFVLSGFYCRRNYSPRRFLLWFGPWLVVGVALGVVAELGRVCISSEGPASLPAVGQLLPGLIVSSSCFAGMLYLLSLPYLYLAFHNDLYRERFQKMLRLPAYVPPEKAPPTSGAEGENPPETAA